MEQTTYIIFWTYNIHTLQKIPIGQFANRMHFFLVYPVITKSKCQIHLFFLRRSEILKLYSTS